jgi:ribose/xylose/arabinose/galactoside ABC-type transport system permease subunit
VTDTHARATERTGEEPESDPTGPARQGATRTAGRLRRPLGLLLDNVVWALIIVFSIGAGLLNSFYLSVPNLQNILVQATSLGVLVFAVSCTLLIGEIDLSVIGTMVFSGLIGAELLLRGWPGPVAIVVTLLVGAAIGWVNGFFVAVVRMNSLISTLAMGLMLQGAVLAVTKARTVMITDTTYTWIGSATIGGWPVMPVALLLVVALAAVVLGWTQWGRNLYATGGNLEAAFVAGINVRAVRVSAFAASGFLAGVAGWLAAAYLSGVNVSSGSSLLLYAVAAPVMGGVSLTGGRGRVAGMIGGALLISVIQVGLQMINVSAYYIQMIGGAMILAAIGFDAARVRLGERGRGA